MTKQDMQNESQPLDKEVIAEAVSGDEDGDQIYLDLDCLLDTRLGTVAKIDYKLATRLLESGKYSTRGIDQFNGIDPVLFQETYAKRDLETLKLSVLTNLPFFLKRLIKDSLASAVVNQKQEKLCFNVNVYPYVFEEPALIEMLIGCIRYHTYSAANVRIIDMSNEELTPTHCGTKYQIMFRYHWLDWVNIHKTFFEKKGFPELSVMVPELFYDRIPSKEEIIKFNLKEKSPFTLTEEITAGLFRLKHIPVSLYSIHESITKKSAKAIAQNVAVTIPDIERYVNDKHPGVPIVHDNPLPVVDLSNLDDEYPLL